MLPRFRLATWLVVCAIAPFALAIAYWQFLGPQIVVVGPQAVPVPKAGTPAARVHPGWYVTLICRRHGSNRELLHAVIRPGDYSQGTGPAWSLPSAKGLSVCGDAVYVDGERIVFNHRPSLLFVSADRTTEIPMTRKESECFTTELLVQCETWQEEVLLLLKQ
jgi:hypothetical protein